MRHINIFILLLATNIHQSRADAAAAAGRGRAPDGRGPASARRGKKHWLAQKHPKTRVFGSDQKHVFLGLTKNTKKHFSHLGFTRHNKAIGKTAQEQSYLFFRPRRSSPHIALCREVFAFASGDGGCERGRRACEICRAPSGSFACLPQCLPWSRIVVCYRQRCSTTDSVLDDTLQSTRGACNGGDSRRLS